MPIEIFGMALFAASMIGTPGPANMVVMASGARFGFAKSIPFLAGTILGKQFVIWPLGLGLMTVLTPDSLVYQILRWASVAYILWLAWRIAGSRMIAQDAGAKAPGFAAGLIVHPLNPKAWAMVIGALTNFTNPEFSALSVTAASALLFVSLQIVLQSLWTLAGAKIAGVVAGTDKEVWLMRALAVLMVGSVIYVLLKGAG